MSIGLFWWIVPVLVGAMFAGVAYWRRNRYPRFMFNMWAPTLYLVGVLVALLLAAGLTALVGGEAKEALDQRTALIGWAMFAAIATGAVALLTLFFNWVVKTDISDIPD